VRLLLAIVFLFSAITQGHALDFSASLLYKVTTEAQSTPADVVIESADTAVIYDAYAGTVTTYKNGKAASTIKKEFLKGGNCFVKNSNYYLYCNRENNSLDLVSDKYEVYSSIKVEKLDPTDALVSDGYAFVADNDNHRIVKIDLASGKLADSVGKYGTNRLQFWYPYALAFDEGGRIAVSEVLGTRVQRITKDFKFYELNGSWGINEGQFYRPTGIVFHKNGYMLVADGYTGLIQYFDNTGKFAGVLKDNFGRKLTFGSVTHIRLKGNTLAVLDAFNKTVFIYELKELN
jgi:hypothetical protein